MFGGNFAPVGWAFCDGSTLSIAQFDTLFNLIGTTYGGDGQNTFQLPDLRGRVPIHQGSGFVIGQLAGLESVTLTTNQIPAHSHVPLASAAADSTNPANGVWGVAAQARPYAAGPNTGPMDPGAVGNTGGNQPHDNMMPFLAVSFIIALEGIFPSPT
jgi:microcystin-dependent protein